MNEQPLNLSERYQAAISTHAHFDNLSVAIITGMVVFTGAAFTVKPPASIPFGGAGVLFIASIVIIVLLRLYENCAFSALVARNLSAEMETDDQGYGISYVSVHIKEDKFEHLAPKQRRGLGRGTRTVTVLAVILCLSLFAGACFEFSHALQNTNAPFPPNKSSQQDASKAGASA